MAASAAKPLESIERSTAKVTSKGQITIPAELRRKLGVETGDQVVFETGADGETRVRKAERYPFERFLGMATGVPELEAGPDAILRYFREARGHEEFDDLD